MGDVIVFPNKEKSRRERIELSAGVRIPTYTPEETEARRLNFLKSKYRLRILQAVERDAQAPMYRMEAKNLLASIRELDPTFFG
jgi:hypothetical protein